MPPPRTATSNFVVLVVVMVRDFKARLTGYPSLDPIVKPKPSHRKLYATQPLRPFARPFSAHCAGRSPRDRHAREDQGGGLHHHRKPGLLDSLLVHRGR